jgi:ribosome-binding factor A
MSNRIRKINELVRELAAESISENISRDYLATVKAVETSRDLKSAIVWVSALNDEEGFLKELEEKKNIIRHEITAKIFAKNTPLVEFRLDRSGEYAQRIEDLLNEKRNS